MGPSDSPTLQAVSPSGDIRLTLRRYTPPDTLSNESLRIRLDLRIQPRDLYAIPSDGHCGYHSLAVLAHPYYPDPPSTAERQEFRRRILEGLFHHPDRALRSAALAACQLSPPSPLPRAHWFRSDWLGLIGDLPPIGCLARHSTPAEEAFNPWFYCTTLSTATTQLEHGLSDLLRVADSGKFMLHQNDHYYPVTPPPLSQFSLPSMCRASTNATGGRPTSGPGTSSAPLAPSPLPPPLLDHSLLPGRHHLGAGTLCTLVGSSMGGLCP